MLEILKGYELDIRVRSVGQCHEREEAPVILDGRVGAILDAVPSLYLRTSERCQLLIPGI